MVSDTFQGGCVCENAAGLRHGTDNVEFAAMCAPRPMFMVGATGDWTKMTMERAYPAIRGVYSLVGSTDRVGAQVFDFPHNYNQTTRNAVYAAMGRWLLGIDEPERPARASSSPRSPRTSSPSAPAIRPRADRKTPAQLEAYLIETRRKQLDEIGPAAGPTRWEAGRRLLLTGLKVRTGIVEPAARVARFARGPARAARGVMVDPYPPGPPGNGEAIPVVRLIPGHPSGRLTVIAHRQGARPALATGDGRADPELVAGDAGAGPRGRRLRPDLRRRVARPARSGRRIGPRPSTSRRYNPAPAAEQMQDLATVLAWCRAQEDVREVSLVGAEQAGYLVLLARPMLEGLARTVIELSEKAIGVDLPGREQFGGLSGAVAAFGTRAALGVRRDVGGRCLLGEAGLRGGRGASMLRRGDRPPAPDAIARWIDRGE